MLMYKVRLTALKRKSEKIKDIQFKFCIIVGVVQVHNDRYLHSFACKILVIIFNVFLAEKITVHCLTQIIKITPLKFGTFTKSTPNDAPGLHRDVARISDWKWKLGQQ